LSGHEEDVADIPLSPLPRPDRRLLFDPAERRQAQSDLSAELARIAIRFGPLDERLGAMGEGILHRLALREVTDFSWWAHARLAN
jgi:hypothetical protein